jgi:hypothetical protein
LCFGISGATRSHMASDTVHDLSALMHHRIATPASRSSCCLRISSNALRASRSIT